MYTTRALAKLGVCIVSGAAMGATPIYDIETFASQFVQVADESVKKDDFFYFCQGEPTFDESLQRFGDRVYEAELEGIVTIQKRYRETCLKSCLNRLIFDFGKL